MKIITTCILVFFFHLTTLAQWSYAPAFVVNNEGDTLKGFINHKEWNKSPTSISFKSSESAPGRQLTVLDCAEFSIEDKESYKRFAVSISLDPVDFSHLSTGIDTSSKTETVFLRTLQDGEHLTLFSYTDDIKTRFYLLEKETGEIKELNFKTFYGANETREIVTLPTFRRQLLRAASKYSTESNTPLVRAIQSAEYDEAALIKITAKINKVEGPNLKKKTRVRYFVGTALNRSAIQYPYHALSTNTSTTVSYAPKVSVGLDALSNAAIQRMIFRAELSFTMAKPKAVSSLSDAVPTENIQSFTQYTMSFNPQLIYNLYHLQKQIFFLGSGLGINFSTYKDAKSITKWGSGNTTGGYEFELPLKNFWLNVPLKTGLFINKKLEVYGTYFLPLSPVDNTQEYQMNLKSMQIGANFLLNNRK